MRKRYLFCGWQQLAIILLISSHSVISQGQVYFNNLEETPTKGNWIGLNTVNSGFAFSGGNFSSADSTQPYGLGIEQEFPNLLLHKNTLIHISGWVKSNIINNHALFVVTLEKNNETILWKGIPLAPFFKEKNQWCYFSDSILVPANLTVGSKLKAYLWNQDIGSTTGIDDLRIEFIAFKNPTFIPDINDLITANEDERTTKVLYTNSYFSIRYTKPEDAISIVSNSNSEIIKNISYLSERKIKADKTYSHLNWYFIGSVKINNGKILNFKSSSSHSKLKLEMKCIDNSNEIQFVVEEKYKEKQTVSRESLVFAYSPVIEEVYRNNRTLDTNNFQNEYWLDKQGIKIGNGPNSLIIYHTPDISSLQLDTESNKLFANLDYEKDHPFFRFPLNPDSSDWKKEESSSKYKKGDRREYRFSLFAGSNPETLPRFMKNPSGFEATYIWTEHADYSDIRTNRATYFGSENIYQSDSAVGGFVGYNIPVTKSIFYDNPDSVSNYNASGQVFKTLECTVLTDSLFSEFLFQIAKKGNEICLHTPEQFTTTPKRLEEALLYMQANFSSPSWIDHGHNNGLQNNREDLICDGTLEGSPYFAINLWNKYGLKYFHNAYYEELNTYNDWQFDSSLEKPYTGFGDFFPKPDYYQHPTRTSNLIHWPTTSALFIAEPYLWDYLFNMDKLKNLVENRAVEINHTYPAWVDPKKGMWAFDIDSTIVAQPGLNLALANFAKLRDEGKLNVCTIEDFLDYRTAIDKIDYSILPDGRIQLTNNSDSDIHNLAMVTKAKAVSVNSLIPNQKKVDDEIIFWFDIKSGNSKIIRVVD